MFSRYIVLHLLSLQLSHKIKNKNNKKIKKNKNYKTTTNKTNQNDVHLYKLTLPKLHTRNFILGWASGHEETRRVSVYVI